jgi:GNAT superfamily N-acetyltransferase
MAYFSIDLPPPKTGSRKMLLRPAHRDELPLLSALCLRSKAVWGYDQVFLEACRTELTIAPHELSNSHIRVAVLEGSVVGIVQITIDQRTADLQKMFVEPSAIGRGVGKALFDWATATANALGADVLQIDADPGAVGFYKKMGAIECGFASSASIPGRMLPRLQVNLHVHVAC